MAKIWFFLGKLTLNLLIIRWADNKLIAINLLDNVHKDYPFSIICRNKRIYTCSLTQNVTAIEFNDYN